MTTFNTAIGRYKFLCLPYGLISCQDVFQQKIDQAYEGLDSVSPIADDILIREDRLQEYEANRIHCNLKKYIKENAAEIQGKS